MTNAPTPKPRYGFVDAERGYIMLLVVFVHVVGGITNAGIAVPQPFLQVSAYAYSFFMPLMFTLSGLFVESSVARGRAEYVRTRVGRLTYLFVLWTLVNGLVIVAGSRFTNHAWDLNPVSWLFWAPVGPLWFLQALIFSQALYGILRFAGIRPLPIAVIGMTMTFASGWMPDTALSHCVMSFGYFALGPIVAPWLLNRLPRLGKPLLVLIAVIGFAIHTRILHTGFAFWLSPLVAVVGAVATVCLGSAFGESKALAPLRALGAASLAIFVMHTLIAAPLRILLQRGFHFENASVHLALGVGCGLLIPAWIWHRWGTRFPWLFQAPSFPIRRNPA